MCTVHGPLSSFKLRDRMFFFSLPVTGEKTLLTVSVRIVRG